MNLLELFKNTKGFNPGDVEFDSTRWKYFHKLADNRMLKVECFETDPKSWGLQFSVGGSYDQTGDGGEIEVFAIVLEALNAFRKDTNPETVYMTSEGGSRTKLYTRLLKRFVPDWRLIGLTYTYDETLLIATSLKEYKWEEFDKEYGVYTFRLGSVRVGNKKYEYMKTIDWAVKNLVIGNLDKEVAAAKKLPEGKNYEEDEE